MVTIYESKRTTLSRRGTRNKDAGYNSVTHGVILGGIKRNASFIPEEEGTSTSTVQRLNSMSVWEAMGF